MDSPLDEIGRIRQILFGHNVSALEQRMLQLQQEMYERIHSLENLLTQLSENLSGTQHQLDDLRKMADEKDQLWAQHHKSLTENLSITNEKLNDEVVKIKQLISTSANELRSTLSLNEVRQSEVIQQMSEQLNQKMNQLQQTKVDRTFMALLLNELALNLGTNDQSTNQAHNKEHE